MNIVSVNVNGIRAAARKGFYDWIENTQPDIVCMQETRALADQINDSVFHPEGYEFLLMPAERKGYSGVGMYLKHEPDEVRYGFGYDVAQEEGRYIEVQLGDLTVASLYLPSGSSSEEAQDKKYKFMDAFKEYLDGKRSAGEKMIVCGDWNIAHKAIDLKNWKANQKNSGFLPEERAWFDVLFGDGELSWVDAFREVNTDEGEYTWWSNRGRAWDNNVGWRLDYHVVSPDLSDAIQAASVYKSERFSDHAPLTIEYDFG